MWAFNTGNNSAPLTDISIPPFVYGRGKYDNWFTHHLIQSNIRHVVDISEAVTTFHLAHKYNHVRNVLVGAKENSNYWSQSKKSSCYLLSLV